MKIRIEMTSEEVSKSVELVAAILPGADVSQYMPNEHQQIDVKCNAYEMTNITDPETGITAEIEIKTHFIAWMLRKMKPFIAAIMSLWHMFTDFYEDMELMMGEVTVLTNGEDLVEKINKMAEEDDCLCTSDESAQ